MTRPTRAINTCRPLTNQLSRSIMAKTDFTAQRLRELLHYDPETGQFTWLKQNSVRISVGDVAGCRTAGKTYIGIDGAIYRAHRLAWLYTYGRWPSKVIDHRDGNPHNNVFSNLREVSQSVNIQNQRRPRRDNASGFLGVEKHGPTWRAVITTSGVRKRFGRYPSPELAHEAYLTAKRMEHEGCTI